MNSDDFEYISNQHSDGSHKGYSNDKLDKATGGKHHAVVVENVKVVENNCANCMPLMIVAGALLFVYFLRR